MNRDVQPGSFSAGHKGPQFRQVLRVGQSLYSIHLDSMPGNNHGFFDPNVWFNEDELRKQEEAYARCIVITGQEVPNPTRNFILTCSKKRMSGDGVAGEKRHGPLFWLASEEMDFLCAD